MRVYICFVRWTVMMNHYQKRERSSRNWKVAMNRCGVMHSRSRRTRNQADELRIPCNHMCNVFVEAAFIVCHHELDSMQRGHTLRTYERRTI